MTEEINLPILSVKDGNVVANSRDVAAYFDKAHFNVLQDIDRLIEQAKPIELGFQAIVVETKVGFGLRMDRAFEMSRDGFTLLAMSFTGKQALQFKLAYIAQFNAMEAELREGDNEEASIVPYTPEIEARLLVGQAQRTFGTKAAQQLWGHLGLPVVPAMLIPESRPQLTFKFGTATAANQNSRAA